VKPRYKIFTSDGGDWFVAARFTPETREIKVLSEGHDYDDALKAILDDSKIQFGFVVRNMSQSGTYQPKQSDWR
jgi:hypothetical protein